MLECSEPLVTDNRLYIFSGSACPETDSRADWVANAVALDFAVEDRINAHTLACCGCVNCLCAVDRLCWVLVGNISSQLRCRSCWFTTRVDLCASVRGTAGRLDNRTGESSTLLRLNCPSVTSRSATTVLYVYVPQVQPSIRCSGRLRRCQKQHVHRHLQVWLDR